MALQQEQILKKTPEKVFFFATVKPI